MPFDALSELCSSPCGNLAFAREGRGFAGFPASALGPKGYETQNLTKP